MKREKIAVQPTEKEKSCVTCVLQRFQTSLAQLGFLFRRTVRGKPWASDSEPHVPHCGRRASLPPRASRTGGSALNTFPNRIFRWHHAASGLPGGTSLHSALQARDRQNHRRLQHLRLASRHRKTYQLPFSLLARNGMMMNDVGFCGAKTWCIGCCKMMGNTGMP